MMQLPANAKFVICNAHPVQGQTSTTAKNVLQAISSIELYAAVLALMAFGPIL
jgi:hypothetical protein